MFESERSRKLAMTGGLFGVIYLAAENALPGLPDLLMGLVLGLGLVCIILSLLPEETLEKIRKWKRRG